jgi:retron-type reverse transcriptase
MEDGSVVPRTAGTPQGGVISPLLANLFLHYAFDAWMAHVCVHPIRTVRERHHLSLQAARRQPEGIDAHQSGNLDWTLHHRSDKSLTELAQMYNPCIRGWITYYSHFYSSSHRACGRRWSPLP